MIFTFGYPSYRGLIARRQVLVFASEQVPSLIATAPSWHVAASATKARWKRQNGSPTKRLRLAPRAMRGPDTAALKRRPWGQIWIVRSRRKNTGDKLW